MDTLLRRAFLLAALAGATPALPAEPSYDYAELRGGIYLPQKPPSVMGGSYRTGIDLELAAGRAFFPFALGEIGVGFVRATAGEHRGFYPGQFYPPMTASFWMVPITATAKLVLPGGSIEPYAFGGIGVYLIRFEKDPTNGLPPVSERRSPVGFHAGLGASWRAAERIRVGLDARYTFVQDTFFGSQNRNVFDGVGVTASLGYRF